MTLGLSYCLAITINIPFRILEYTRKLTGWVWPANALYSLDMFILERTIKPSELEYMLLQAYKINRAVCITRDSGKVYVGLVVSAPNPDKDMKIVQLMPWYSGYRDEKKRTIYTTDYSGVYEQLHNNSEDLSHIDLPDLIMAVPVSGIISMGFFDENVNQIMDESNDFHDDILSSEQEKPEDKE